MAAKRGTNTARRLSSTVPMHNSRDAKSTETVAMVAYPSLKKKKRTRNHAVLGVVLTRCANRR